MTKLGSVPNLAPFIDNLWYFDSVVSTKAALKQGKPAAPPPPPPPPVSEKPAADDSQHNHAALSETQLPLSSGGESSPRAAYSSCYTDQQGISDDEAGEGEGCASCNRAGSQRPSMCELVDKMEEGEGELPAAELYLWMQKLGLEYTADGAMIRRIPNTDFGSQQQLDFSEFVCLNQFIEDERSSSKHVKHHVNYSDARMASLYEVFRLFDKDDTGLISPSDLCAALAKLGLRRTS